MLFMLLLYIIIIKYEKIILKKLNIIVVEFNFICKIKSELFIVYDFIL